MFRLRRYKVQWQSLHATDPNDWWMTIDSPQFFYLRSARRYVGDRVCTPRNARHWRIVDTKSSAVVVTVMRVRSKRERKEPA